MEEAKQLIEIQDQFAYLEKHVMELDELDKCRYLRYVASKILSTNCRIQIEDLISMGDLCQKTEIVCATLKKIIIDTKVELICKKCEKKISMKLEHHLKGLNGECPHDQFEFLDEKEFKKASLEAVD